MLRKILSLGVFLTVFLCPVRAQVQYVSTAEDIALGGLVLKELASAAGREDGPELMVRAAKRLLDQKYVAGTQEGRDEKLRIFLTQTDCILFAETCLGLVRTAQRCGADATFEDLAETLLLSRYRDGVVDRYESRLHYVTEWVAQGERTGLFRDLTAGLGGVPDPRPINYMTTHSGSYAPLAGESGYARDNRARMAAIEERISGIARTYIPKSQIPYVESQIRSGDILCFTTAIEGLDVSHVVIAYREKPSDRLGFIHASINEKKVIIDPRTLETALAASRNITGIKVLRVQP
ncbi:MAG: DUF1460 domain-containing protein [Bacteroidales bacterium]|jgi:hypothetical protein|nr:DUF1460 domain-containing protein [Bacteroidales bacterium]